MAGNATVLLLSVASVLFCRLLSGSVPGWLVCGLTGTQIAAMTWMASGKWEIRYRMILAAGSLAVALILLTALPMRIAALVAAGFCHTVACTGLLIWFGMSLRPGREPLVTRFARRVRSGMPEKVVRYTRWVTIAWCMFFAAQLAVSAALLLLMPASVWSAFVGLFNLPLLAAMVLGEFGVRLVLFRHEPHTNLLATLAAWRQGRALTIGRP